MHGLKRSLLLFRKNCVKKGFLSIVAENPKTKVTLEYAGVQSSFGCLQQYQMLWLTKQ